QLERSQGTREGPCRMAERMGDAAYPDKWVGRMKRRGRNPNSRVHPLRCDGLGGRKGQASLRQSFRRVRASTRVAHCRPPGPPASLLLCCRKRKGEKMEPK